MFDVIIFGMTINRTLRARRLSGRGVVLSGSALIDIVYRDGTFLFTASMRIPDRAYRRDLLLVRFLSLPASNGLLTEYAQCDGDG